MAGGARHLALAQPLIRGEALAWPSPLPGAFPALLARRPQPVAVLASGDPFWFGIGATLARLVPPEEIAAFPAPSAFSLACARLGWAVQDVATLSCCGRPVEAVLPLLQPGARVLALSADASTPGLIAALLRRHCFGDTRLRVLEALGGPRERICDGVADDIDPLNLVALEVGALGRVLPLAAGLPEGLFDHDGQITKQEIRAVTLAALAPRRGELLWDIGSGSGSVGIEWMLRHPANHAVAIERRADRATSGAANAAALGVPGLRVVTGVAPAALEGLPPPDAVFVGGGARDPAVTDAAWAALKPGGRLVAHAVTVETEAALIALHQRLGGRLTRLAVERLAPIGRMHGFRPAMTVTQFAADKP